MSTANVITKKMKMNRKSEVESKENGGKSEVESKENGGKMRN